MGGFSIVDVCICLILLGGMALGYSRGLVRSFFDLVVTYVALGIAAQYTPLVRHVLRHMLPAWPTYVINSVLFLAVGALVATTLGTVVQALLRSGSKRRQTELSTLAGFFIGALTAAALVSVFIPVVEHGASGSWGTWDSHRESMLRSLASSYLVPFFHQLTPVVLTSIKPLLPAGLPEALRGAPL